MVYTDLIKFEF